MYIALYNEEQKHVANVTYATYELTERVYDADGFSAEGVCEDTTTDTKIAVLNDDAGNYKYACFTDGITVDGNKQTVKGIPKFCWIGRRVLTGNCRRYFKRSKRRCLTARIPR